MKKSMVLLSILLFSFFTIIPTTFPVEAQVVLDPLEANGAVGRPYQDLTEVKVGSNGTHLSLNITLDQGPPKIDNETHLNMYVAIDTTTGGAFWIGDAGVDAVINASEDYWEWCLALYSWTGLVPQSANLIDSNFISYNALTMGVTITNSSDGRVVRTKIPLSAIGNPTSVTVALITHEDGTYGFRDTIGNATAQYPSWGQQLGVNPFTRDLPTTAGSSASASDSTKDFVIHPFNDITKVEVGYDAYNIIVNVTFANVTNLDAGTGWNWAQRWDLSIAMDTDHLVNDTNQSWMAYTQYDTRIDPVVNNTYWERCVVIDSLTDIHLFNENLNDLGAMGITAALLKAQNKVKVSIPKGLIPFGLDRKLNMTIISGTDYDNTIYDVVGTWTYAYDPAVNMPQGLFLVSTSIPPTEEILPEWPGDLVPTPTSATGRPYQDITGVTASGDGTNLKIGVALNQEPPKQDNETHVNIYVAIDNGTAGGSWVFPDEIDAGYNISAYFWEYCLALYNWTQLGGGAQSFKLFRINEYVDPPRTPSWSEISTTGIIVTNSSATKSVNMTIPLTLIGSPSTVTLGVVTSEDFAKVKDTVGYSRTRLSFSQWVEIRPAITALSTATGSKSATDPANDFTGKSFWDITAVTVGMKDYVITVNVTFQDVTALLWSMDQWGLAIGIDTNHSAGVGEDWMAFVGPADTQINPTISTAYWERCVVLNSLTDITVYDENYNNLGSLGISASLIETQNKISVRIPSWNLPPTDNPRDRCLNLTIMSGTNGGSTVYDVYGTWTYNYDPAVNTQGFYLLNTAIKTGVVMYPYPLPGVSFNTAMGRPYQDITNVWAKSGSSLNVSVTLREAPPTAAYVNLYVAIDTEAGGQDWFPDNIDARYNISEPEHYWDYCLALYSWTDVDLIDKNWVSTDAIAQGVNVTTSAGGRTVNMSIPLALIGNPSTITLGVVTSEDDSKIKDTVGNGTAIPLGFQWIQIEPAIIDLPIDGSSISVTDDERDFCGKAFWDITNIVVNVDINDVIIDVTFLNVSGLSTFWDQWWLAVEIDTDHQLGSGEPWTYAPGPGTDTRFANESVSEWEVCAVLDSLDDIDLYNVSFVSPPHGVTASLIEAQNKVQVVIPKSWLMLQTWTDYNLTLTVVSGVDAGWRVYDIYGTYDYGYNLIGAGSQGVYIAHTDPSLNETGPFKAELSMLNGALKINKVNLNLDQYFVGPDAKLVAKFYFYDGVLQATNSNILGYTFDLPRRVTANINITHPTQDCISIIEILLTDNTGTTVYSVVARFIVTRAVLMQRLGRLDMLWPVPGADRSAIMKEYVIIDGQWPYAPP